LTAHNIAELVQEKFDSIDFNEMLENWKDIPVLDSSGFYTISWQKRKFSPEFTEWLVACGKLEDFLKQHPDSEQTDLVYTWAKQVCEKIIKEKNLQRAFLNPRNY
jgi:hypothetical protein